MRRSHPSEPPAYINPALLRATAREGLQLVLPWRAVGRRLEPGQLLDLLLLIAALRSSLWAVARRFHFGCSHETARKAVYAQLPEDLRRLQEGLLDGLDALRRRGRRYRRRPVVAIDLVYHPYYGARGTAGVVGGPKKQGTKYFFAYATAVLIHRRHRYTVGLLAVDQKRKPHAILQELLDQLAARGIR